LCFPLRYFHNPNTPTLPYPRLFFPRFTVLLKEANVEGTAEGERGEKVKVKRERKEVEEKRKEKRRKKKVVAVAVVALHSGVCTFFSALY